MFLKVFSNVKEVHENFFQAFLSSNFQSFTHSATFGVICLVWGSWMFLFGFINMQFISCFGKIWVVPRRTYEPEVVLKRKVSAASLLLLGL